jgi:hypothetical protein
LASTTIATAVNPCFFQKTTTLSNRTWVSRSTIMLGWYLRISSLKCLLLIWFAAPRFSVTIHCQPISWIPQLVAWRAGVMGLHVPTIKVGIVARVNFRCPPPYLQKHDQALARSPDQWLLKGSHDDHSTHILHI